MPIVKVKSLAIPLIVPASFEDWVKAHFRNPNEEPIRYTSFELRKPAPNLHLKKLNHKFEQASFNNLSKKMKWN